MLAIWVIFICFIFIISVGVKENSDKITKNKEIRVGHSKHHNYIKDKYGVFEDLPSLQCVSGFGEIKKTQGCYMFKKEDNLHLSGIPSKNNILNSSYFNNGLREFGTGIIQINSIEYFHLTGQKLTVTKGEGGGSSLGGALLGSAIAGGTGAVIGSRKKTNIDTKIVDDRNAILVYNNPTTNSVEHIAFSPKAYDLFLKLIPDKELGHIQNKRMLNS